jgi:hypothetical protein
MSKIFPLTNETFIKCGEGCDKPGLAHPDHNPYDNSCGDCAMFCCPCAFVTDVFTLPFRTIMWLWKKLRHSKSSDQNTEEVSGWRVILVRVYEYFFYSLDSYWKNNKKKIEKLK